MFFGFPWALSALIVLPACLAVYLFQRRSRETRVSALFLWDLPESNYSQGPKVDRFRAPWRLLLELLIFAALALAASDPCIQIRRQSHPTWLILDDSWSMQPFYQAARQELLDYWKRQKTGYPVRLVFMGTQPRAIPACPDYASLSRELALWNPKQEGADCAAALQLIQGANASPIRSDLENAKTDNKKPTNSPVNASVNTHMKRDGAVAWIITDHSDALEEEIWRQNARLRFWSVGKPTENVAWTQCVRNSVSSELDCVRAEIVNWSKTKRQITVVADQFSEPIVTGDRILPTKPVLSQTFSVALDPSGSTALAQNVPADRSVRWSLPEDALSYDNIVWSLPAVQREIQTKVAVASLPIDQRIRKALTLAQTGKTRIQFVDETADPATDKTADKPAGKPTDEPTDNPVSAPSDGSSLKTADKKSADRRLDLLITDSAAQASGAPMSPTGWIVLFYRENESASRQDGPSQDVETSATAALTTFSSPFLSKSVPLLKGTDFRSVLWTADQSTAAVDRLMARGEVLLAHGNTALISDERTSSGRRILYFRLRPEFSNLMNTPNWPILAANLVSERAKTLPGEEKPAVRQPINASESNLLACDSLKREPALSPDRLKKEFVSLQIPLILFAAFLSCLHLILLNVKRET